MIDPKIKSLLGFESDKPDDEALAEWKVAATRVCKPCWELKYCPYGPWVEDSPLLPSTRKEAEKYQEYLKNCLKTGILEGGEPLDDDADGCLKNGLMNSTLRTILKKSLKKLLRWHVPFLVIFVQSFS